MSQSWETLDTAGRLTLLKTLSPGELVAKFGKTTDFFEGLLKFHSEVPNDLKSKPEQQSRRRLLRLGRHLCQRAASRRRCHCELERSRPQAPSVVQLVKYSAYARGDI